MDDREQMRLAEAEASCENNRPTPKKKRTIAEIGAVLREALHKPWRNSKEWLKAQGRRVNQRVATGMIM